MIIQYSKKINENVSDSTTVLLNKRFHKFLFENLENEFAKDGEFAKFLEVHKATLSAWKVRKNRIPYIFLKICAEPWILIILKCTKT